MRNAPAYLAALASLALAAGPAPCGEPPSRGPSHLGALDAGERGVAEARIVEVRPGPAGLPVFDADEAVLARTGAAGTVTPAPSPPSPAGRLAVWAPGLAAVLVPGGLGPSLVRLTPAAPLAGRLFWDGGAPAAGLVLEALPLAGAADLVHRTHADESGRYAFEHLPPGRYRLEVVRAQGTRQDLGVAAAGTTPLDLSLPRGARLSAEVRDLDAEGREGAAGLRIRLVRLADSVAAPAATCERACEKDGRVAFDEVPPGVYEAVLLDPDRLWDGPPPRVEVASSVAQRLPPWSVRRRGTLEGKVLDKEDRPLPGAVVVVSPPPGVAEPAGGFGGKDPATAGRDGGFRVARLAPAAGWRLLLSSPGFSPVVVAPVEVVGNRTVLLAPARLPAAWSLSIVVRDPEGRPVPKALVVATPASRPAPDPADVLSAALLRTGTTDAEGRTSLSDLPEADVALRASAPGFVEAVLTVAEPLGRRLLEQAIVVAPAATVRGRVSAREGVPAGLRVRAVVRSTGAARWAEIGPGGTFEVSGLSPTPVDLEAVAAGASEALVLARAEAVLPGSREPVVLSLAPTHRVSGIARGLSPSGPAGAVRLEVGRRDPSREETRWVVAAEVPLSPGASDAPFSFPAVPPGPCALRVVQGLRDGGSVPVLVEGRDKEGIDLVLPEGAHLAGRVVDARARAAAIGARVTLARLEGDGPAPRPDAAGLLAIADGDGRFAFDDVAAGLWRVEASDRGAAGARADVRLVEGGRADVGSLTLTRGGAIEGTLLDRKRRGIAGVLVRVLRKPELDEALRATSGEDGAFRAAPLPAGRYALRVEDRPDAEPAVEAEAEVVEGETTRVDLSASGRGQITGTARRRGAAVAGVVLEAVVDDACGCDRLVRRTASDAFGRFRWEGLPAGRYALRALDGGVESAVRVVLADGDRVDRDVDLGEAGIVGSVRTAAGEPVREAEVLAYPAGSTTAGVDGRARTGPDGSFAVSGLPSGPYRLEILPPGRATRVVEGVFADLPGSGRPVDVVLGLGAQLDLLVHDEGRRGVAAAEVWVEDASGRALHARPFFTSPSGRVHIEGLPEGAARVRVHARGLGLPRPAPITLKDGAGTAADMTLRPAGAVRLVVAAGRDPVARARVDVLRLPERERIEVRRPLRRGDEFAGFGITTRVGLLAIEDLEEGDYLLVVSAGTELLESRVPVRVRRGEAVEARVFLEFRPR